MKTFCITALCQYPGCDTFQGVIIGVRCKKGTKWLLFLTGAH